MTLPCERYNAIKNTEKFLMDLCDPKKTPRVPKDVRAMARSCLRHYPGNYHLDVMSTKCPEIVDSGNKIDDLTMLLHDYEQRRNNYG
jgi:hypothetical protein